MLGNNSETNQRILVEGRELTYLNSIKIWDKIAI